MDHKLRTIHCPLSTYVQNDFVEERDGVAEKEQWHKMPIYTSSQAFKINIGHYLIILLGIRQEIECLVRIFRHDRGSSDVFESSIHDILTKMGEVSDSRNSGDRMNR